MIYYPAIEQGTEEWFSLRAGKITSSVADKLLTPTGKISTQYRNEIGRIIAEMMGLQEPERMLATSWMDRGTRLEDEARKWFTVETGLDVEQIGFVATDDGLAGASPDGLVQSNVPLELKVPKPSTHIRWLLEGGLPKEHVQQVHFHLVVCEADHCHFMSYCQDLEPLMIRVEADEYTEKMQKALDSYRDDFRSAYRRILGEDYVG